MLAGLHNCLTNIDYKRNRRQCLPVNYNNYIVYAINSRARKVSRIFYAPLKHANWKQNHWLEGK